VVLETVRTDVAHQHFRLGWDAVEKAGVEEDDLVGPGVEHAQGFGAEIEACGEDLVVVLQ
jgi:hypothetical protein